MAAVAYPRHPRAARPASEPLGRCGAPGRGPGAGRSRRVVRPGMSARRRAAVVVGLLALAVALRVVVGWVAAGWSSRPVDPHASGRALRQASDGSTYVVQPGDTLWAIARHLQPTGDVRPLVERLRRTNGRTSLVPGERLVLPP